MKRTIAAAAIVMGSAALFSGSAFADPYTPVNPPSSTMHVGLQVVEECTISTTDLDFGSIGLMNAGIDGTGSVTVRCTHETPYEIGLSGGASNDTADRTMSAGGTADKVHYQLYTASNDQTVWGNDPGNDTVNISSGTGVDETRTIYGHATAQNVAAGTYGDDVVATVWYDGTYVTPTP